MRDLEQFNKGEIEMESVYGFVESGNRLEEEKLAEVYDALPAITDMEDTHSPFQRRHWAYEGYDQSGGLAKTFFSAFSGEPEINDGVENGGGAASNLFSIGERGAPPISYSSREICEILLKHNASSDSLIAHFLNTYKEGNSLKRLTVFRWRLGQQGKVSSWCETYDEQRVLVSKYANFLDEQLISSTNPQQMASIRKEVGRIVGEKYGQHSIIRGECEVLFRHGACSGCLIVSFLNIRERWGGGRPFGGRIVDYWRSGRGDQAPTWCEAYGQQRALVSRYENFLEEQLKKATHFPKRALIMKEKKRIEITQTNPMHTGHPFRAECEILFEYGARSDSLIVLFLNSYKGGRSMLLDHITVQRWFLNRRKTSFCKAYVDAQKLIFSYRNFLDTQLEVAPASSSPFVRAEIGRITEHIHSPKGVATTKERKRGYDQAFPKTE